MIDSLDILHQTNHIGQEIDINSDREIVFWILMVFNLISIAVVRTVRPAYLQALFSTALINRQLLQKYQEELKLFSFSSALLTLTYFVNVGVLISYLINTAYGFFALLMIGILIVVVLIKLIVMWLITVVTETNHGILEHALNHLVFFQVAGIILTPVIIITHFLGSEIQETIVLSCLFLAVFLILLRELHSIGRSIKARISLLYIILYLCTLELLPLVVIIYAFVNNMIGLN